MPDTPRHTRVAPLPFEKRCCCCCRLGASRRAVELSGCRAVGHHSARRMRIRSAAVTGQPAGEPLSWPVHPPAPADSRRRRPPPARHDSVTRPRLHNLRALCPLPLLSLSSSFRRPLVPFASALPALLPSDPPPSQLRTPSARRQLAFLHPSSHTTSGPPPAAHPPATACHAATPASAYLRLPPCHGLPRPGASRVQTIASQVCPCLIRL